MADHVSIDLLSQLSKFITSLMGLYFPESRFSDLERGIKHAAQEFAFTDTEAFIKWLLPSKLTKRHIEILSSHLTVGETYFFRDKQSFEVFEEHILPELIKIRQKKGRYLRIWSAGCSSGEEAYSIAILLKKLISDINDWNIVILATDINPHFLKKASAGIYTDWSFRRTPSFIKEKYFRRTKNGDYRIITDIKKMVVFEYLNLAEDIYPSLLNNTNGMDIIFCHNVIMYFSPEILNKAVQGFYNSLVDTGWLSVGPTDFIRQISFPFIDVNFGEATLYKKDAEKTYDYKNSHKKAIPLPLPVIDTSKSQESRERDDVNLSLYRATAEKRGKTPEKGGQKADIKENDTLIKTYANSGRLDDALEECKKAIASDKLNPYYYYLLATILIEHGKIDDAVKSLKRAIYLDNDFILAYFILGNLMLRNGELKTSKKYFENTSRLLSKYKFEEIIP